MENFSGGLYESGFNQESINTLDILNREVISREPAAGVRDEMRAQAPWQWPHRGLGPQRDRTTCPVGAGAPGATAEAPSEASRERPGFSLPPAFRALAGASGEQEHLRYGAVAWGQDLRASRKKRPAQCWLLLFPFHCFSNKEGSFYTGLVFAPKGFLSEGVLHPKLGALRYPGWGGGAVDRIWGAPGRGSPVCFRRSCSAGLWLGAPQLPGV